MIIFCGIQLANFNCCTQISAILKHLRCEKFNKRHINFTLFKFK